MRRILSISSTLLLCAVFATLTAAPAAAHGSRGRGGAAHGHRHKRHRTASEAQVAKSLVARLSKAHSEKAKEKALLAMMRALHISVVTATGKPLVVAPEPNAARGFALYDFELRGLGDDFSRGPTTDLAGVATGLSEAGLTLGPGKPLPPALLRAGLLAAVREAVHKPHTGSSLLPLVVRELGLRHPNGRYDLASHKVPKVIPLDGLQAWLISADMEISVLRHVRPAGARASSLAPAASPGEAAERALSSLRALLGPRAQSSSITGDCEQLSKASEELGKKLEQALGGKIQKWIESKAVGKIYDKVTGVLGRKITRWGIKNLPRWAVRGPYEVLKAVNLAKPILDALHGVLLAFSIDVRGGAERVGPVHWYHSAGESGHQMVFETKVTMLDNYGELLVKCGTLAGFQMPPPGPVKGVLVGWTEAEATKPLWPDMGSVGCTVICVTETNEQGVARLTFTPKQELIPGIGLEREETGVVTGTAAYQTAEGSGIPEELAQYLTPKQSSTRWSVTYHKEPNLTLRLVDRHEETFTNAVEWENSFGEAETTGTGAGSFAISAVAPLQGVTTTDGASLWTGDAPINWDSFSFHDDEGGSLCQDGKMGEIDYDGSAPSPGELVVDSVAPQKGAAAPALAVTFHASRVPGFQETQTFRPGASRCADFSNSFPRDWWVGPSDAMLGQPGIETVGWQAPPHGTGTFRITGFQPGPAIQTGEGVYAYRDFSYSGTDAYEQPYHGTMRLEIDATPKP